MPKKNIKVRKTILVSSICFIIYLFLDITNCFSVWNFKLENLSDGVFSGVLNALVVVSLYIISYFVIDKRSIRKEQNAKEVVDVLIKETYKSCNEMLILLENEEMMSNHIFPKVSNDKPMFADDLINHLRTSPFSSYETIMQFCVNGIVRGDYVKEYLYVKSTYEGIVSTSIVAFGVKGQESEFQAHIIKRLNQDIQSLKNLFSIALK